MHPVDLKQSIGNDGNMASSLGNFGHINYGSTIIGRVHYPVSNRNGCQEFDADVDFSNDILFNEEDDMNPIIMVDRGDCHFV